MVEEPVDFLKMHLNVNWLRPESALWDAVASNLICKLDIAPPSLDLGCGNGIFSFITFGGDFSIDYDWYINVKPEGFWKNKDIYDACEQRAVKGFIIKKPKCSFNVGLDYKGNLLRQAEKLNFYQNIIQHNANYKLPFADSQFNTVFSNILYWLNDLEKSLKELYRVLDEQGVAILCIPNTKFLEYCRTYRWRENRSQLLRLLNHGRLKSLRWVMPYNDFALAARSAGFRIIQHSYYLSPLILKIWDVGLRPLSPVLIKMANMLDARSRREIKSEWIANALKFLLPIFDMEKKQRQEGGFHLFVLKKQELH